MPSKEYHRRLNSVLKNPSSTYEELAKLFGVNSKSTVHKQLSKFRRDGVLNWRDNCPRSFTTIQTKAYSEVTEDDQRAIIDAVVKLSRGEACILPECLYNVFSRFTLSAYPSSCLTPAYFYKMFEDCPITNIEIEELRHDLLVFLRRGRNG